MKKKKQQIINKFTGKYRFLSNFNRTDIYYEGLYYPSVEHAFQAAKSLNDLIREKLSYPAITPAKAKRMARKIDLRPDWKDVKDEIMLTLIRIKFEDFSLQKKLLETGDAQLIEGNWWSDTYWGVCKGKGQNKLGRILMYVREEIKNNKG